MGEGIHPSIFEMYQAISSVILSASEARPTGRPLSFGQESHGLEIARFFGGVYPEPEDKKYLHVIARPERPKQSYRVKVERSFHTKNTTS